ncbi:hypothetical protein DIPPA_23901 [Diplonema papillatum]|nr:hypothetical protein DIPPA_23901 [Diplonema papillatum]
MVASMSLPDAAPDEPGMRAPSCRASASSRRSGDSRARSQRLRDELLALQRKLAKEKARRHKAEQLAKCAEAERADDRQRHATRQQKLRALVARMAGVLSEPEEQTSRSIAAPRDRKQGLDPGGPGEHSNTSTIDALISASEIAHESRSLQCRGKLYPAFRGDYTGKVHATWRPIHVVRAARGTPPGGQTTASREGER